MGIRSHKLELWERNPFLDSVGSRIAQPAPSLAQTSRIKRAPIKSRSEQLRTQNTEHKEGRSLHSASSAFPLRPLF